MQTPPFETAITSQQTHHLPQSPVNIKHNALQQWCPRAIAPLRIERLEPLRRSPHLARHGSSKWLYAESRCPIRVKRSDREYSIHLESTDVCISTKEIRLRNGVSEVTYQSAKSSNGKHAIGSVMAVLRTFRYLY